jgi:hypothetical protein
MEVIRGTGEHARAVADYWNAVTLDDDSWWFGAPMRTPEEIAGLIDQGFTLVVALDGKHLAGFGLWLGPNPIGFTATDRRVFLRIVRMWCEENPGQKGTAIVSARDSREIRWIHQLGVTEFRPLGYKPLKRGEAKTARKVWQYQATVDLDSLLNKTDRMLAEVVRS